MHVPVAPAVDGDAARTSSGRRRRFPLARPILYATAVLIALVLVSWLGSRAAAAEEPPPDPLGLGASLDTVQQPVGDDVVAPLASQVQSNVDPVVPGIAHDVEPALTPVVDIVVPMVTPRVDHVTPVVPPIAAPVSPVIAPVLDRVRGQLETLPLGLVPAATPLEFTPELAPSVSGTLPIDVADDRPAADTGGAPQPAAANGDAAWSVDGPAAASAATRIARSRSTPTTPAEGSPLPLSPLPVPLSGPSTPISGDAPRAAGHDVPHGALSAAPAPGGTAWWLIATTSFGWRSALALSRLERPG